MADDLASILEAPPAPTPEEMGQSPAAEQPAAAPSRPRDEMGKFAPQQAQVEQAAPEPAAPEDPRDKELKGLKAALAEQRQKMRDLEQRFAPQPEAKAPEAPEQAPDPDVDPIAALKWERKQREELIAKQQERDRMTQEQQYDMQVGTFITTKLQEYEADAPDINDALTFAISKAREEGVNAGLSADEITGRIKSYMREIATTSAKFGMNPGVFIQQVARGYGYQPTARETPANDPAPAPVAPRPKAPPSLSSMTGGTPTVSAKLDPLRMSTEEIGGLSDAEFRRMNGV